MLVETFEATEVDSQGVPECDDAAVALIEQLGLSGQQKLLQRREGDSGTKVLRSPYCKMTADEQAVYGFLCPKQTTLHKYEDGPIPLRVLQVAAHATEFFEEIRVWSPKEARIKDPVLVGYTDKNQYGNFEGLFILARWGEVLEDFGVLTKRAGESAKASFKAGLEEVIAKCQQALASIPHTADSEYITKSTPNIWLH